MKVKGMVVVMTFSLMAWKSLGLKWTTEELHTNCCEGEDKMLMWNYSLEKNETVQDNRWFFQSTQIAYVSESVKFHVHPLYKGRLEQIAKMVILLKNVSSVDTGNYSLYLNLGPEPPANMQTIFLTVLESPTCQCKPSITKHSENVLFCSANSSGGIQLSTEWRISEKYDFVSNASSLKINSSWNAELVSCCLYRQCEKCNLLDVCESAYIFFAEDKHDCKYTENRNEILTSAVIGLATTNFLSIVTVVICFYNIRKIHRLCAKQWKDAYTEQEPNMDHEAHPMPRGAKQRADTDIERVPNMDKGHARPLMGVCVLTTLNTNSEADYNPVDSMTSLITE